MATFKLIFKADVAKEQALAPLKKEIEDGELGSMKVEPNSLKVPADENNTKGTWQLELYKVPELIQLFFKSLLRAISSIAQ